ncbi:Hypothetical predicted protein [Cloeon dipterum]|uniref:Uncharacterized protein n=1 Tax=Cloeon dipterum TaxID=197152 RepID=A0A8S1BXL8_9INSE|nr:Hypothetical predicted protein [Cloeon dipterum]
MPNEERKKVLPSNVIFPRPATGCVSPRAVIWKSKLCQPCTQRSGYFQLRQIRTGLFRLVDFILNQASMSVVDFKICTALLKKKQATDVGTRRSSALKVHLDNHTECHCRPRALPPPTTAAPPPADSRTRAGRTAYFGDVAGAYQRHPASHKPVPVRENCVCPSRFTARNFANGTCTCDCFDRERDCLRLKKGRESFSVEDSDCIGDGRCRRPTCEFGEYLDVSDRGRCPLRDERIFPLYSRSEAQTRRALAPVVPPLPQPSWKWTPPDTPQGVPRVEVPSWAVHHHRIAWPAPRSQPTLPPPVVAPAWSRPTTAPPATTTNTPRPPWNPQPIRTTPSSFPLLGGKDSLVAASRYHLPSKWSLAGTIENGGGFAWNPEETMRHVSKHSSRKI